VSDIAGKLKRGAAADKLSAMTRAYDEIVDFIAAGTTPQMVARFEASQATKDYVAELIRLERTSGLTPEQASELDHLMQLEHIMRLAKARARAFAALPIHSKGFAP
jgi:hypothetical protein